MNSLWRDMQSQWQANVARGAVPSDAPQPRPVFVPTPMRTEDEPPPMSGLTPSAFVARFTPDEWGAVRNAARADITRMDALVHLFATQLVDTSDPVILGLVNAVLAPDRANVVLGP